VVIPAPETPEAEAPEHHEPILTALARAYHWQRLLDEGRMTSGVEIARQEGLNQSSVNELLRLTLLSPRIVRALLAGRQPKTLTLRWLKNHELPADWEAQGEVFGGLTGRAVYQRSVRGRTSAKQETRSDPDLALRDWLASSELFRGRTRFHRAGRDT
jgi:hypothetical protein